jgi:hypothetical protein
MDATPEATINHIDLANLHLNRSMALATMLECCLAAHACPHSDLLAVVGTMLRDELKAIQTALDNLEPETANESPPSENSSQPRTENCPPKVG